LSPGAPQDQPAPHIPVLIGAIIDQCSPIEGVWLDGTFGAGGYTRELLDAGAECVIAVDRDPSVFEMAADWAVVFGDRLRFTEGTFGNLDRYADQPLDGVVLDLGVSSMQLDQAERGFSFMRDGPLDMRMGQSGPSAADLVNDAEEAVLADVLFHLGEERAARRIARAIVRARTEAPIRSTGALAEVITGVLPRAKPGQSHPATRSFQAIRIAVNDELSELVQALEAAERALRPGGKLAVVTFHSIEDRIVKRYFQQASGSGGSNRYAPEAAERAARLVPKPRKAISASDSEVAANPRARSARLRIAIRTDAAAGTADRSSLGLPGLYTLQEKPS